MLINKKLIKFNFNDGRKGNSIKYIVIHDTGNKNKGADSTAHFNYFNGGNRNASAHYFVDDKQILQVVEDKNTSWHCGDGKGKYGITNYNSIGIEICVNSDGNYEKAFKSTIELTKKLMTDYKIPVERVVRHYDASRKMCPASMSLNDWNKWAEFKNKLETNTSINSVDVAIKRLIEIGVISTADYWFNAIKCVNYLDQLLIAAANKCKNVKNQSFNEIELAIDKLVLAEIIKSPAYWYRAIGIIKYSDTLILNIANRL